MNKIFTLYLLAVTSNVVAQQALPQNITPLRGELQLRLTPTFEARCQTNNFEKKSGDFFGSRTSVSIAHHIFEDSGGDNRYSMTFPVDGFKNISLSISIDRSGSQFGYQPVKIEADGPIAPGMEKFMSELGARFFKVGDKPFAIGLPLRHGQVVSSSPCQLLPGGAVKLSRGGYSIQGTTTIQDRKALVLSGEQTLSCISDLGNMDIDIKGWQAIDVQSGLTISKSSAGTTKLASEGLTSFTEDVTCLISGTEKRSANNNQEVSTGKKAEQRLSEIKSLLEKGLITREQFDAKRTEILKSL